MDALDSFWHELSEFLNMILGWGNAIDQPPWEEIAFRMMNGEDSHWTNPTGHAECVRHAIQQVDADRLPSGQASLFLTAAGLFETLSERHGFVTEGSSWCGAVDGNDRYFQALRQMASNRIATSPIPIENGEPPCPILAPSLPSAPPPKKARRMRDEGKTSRCVGIYMDAIGRLETPPTPSEIARQARCSVSTASRAIKRWEDRRLAEAKEDAKGRYRCVE